LQGFAADFKMCLTVAVVY